MSETDCVTAVQVLLFAAPQEIAAFIPTISNACLHPYRVLEVSSTGNNKPIFFSCYTHNNLTIQNTLNQFVQLLRIYMSCKDAARVSANVHDRHAKTQQEFLHMSVTGMLCSAATGGVKDLLVSLPSCR